MPVTKGTRRRDAAGAAAEALVAAVRANDEAAVQAVLAAQPAAAGAAALAAAFERGALDLAERLFRSGAVPADRAPAWDELRRTRQRLAEEAERAHPRQGWQVPLAPAQTNRVAAHLAELRETGITPLAGLLGDDAQGDIRRHLARHGALDGAPHLRELANDPLLLRLVAEYQGGTPTIRGIEVFRGGKGGGAPRRDIADSMPCTLFLLLSEVALDGAAWRYFSGTHDPARLAVQLRGRFAPDFAAVVAAELSGADASAAFLERACRDSAVALAGAAGRGFLVDMSGYLEGASPGPVVAIRYGLVAHRRPAAAIVPAADAPFDAYINQPIADWSSSGDRPPSPEIAAPATDSELGAGALAALSARRERSQAFLDRVPFLLYPREFLADDYIFTYRSALLHAMSVCYYASNLFGEPSYGLHGYRTILQRLLENGRYTGYRHFIFLGDDHLSPLDYLVQSFALDPCIAMQCRVNDTSLAELSGDGPASPARQMLDDAVSCREGDPAIVLQLGARDCRAIAEAQLRNPATPLAELVGPPIEAYRRFLDRLVACGHRRLMIILPPPEDPAGAAAAAFGAALRVLAPAYDAAILDPEGIVEAPLDTYRLHPGARHLSPRRLAPLYLPALLAL
jgi:hypothetical protein